MIIVLPCKRRSAEALSGHRNHLIKKTESLRNSRPNRGGSSGGHAGKRAARFRQMQSLLSRVEEDGSDEGASDEGASDEDIPEDTAPEPMLEEMNAIMDSVQSKRNHVEDSDYDSENDFSDQDAVTVTASARALPLPASTVSAIPRLPVMKKVKQTSLDSFTGPIAAVAPRPPLRATSANVVRPQPVVANKAKQTRLGAFFKRN